MPSSPEGLTPEEELALFFTGEHPGLEKARRVLRLLPASPRCRVCYAPFGNVGGALVRRRGFTPWSKNPNICQRCVVEISSVKSRGTEIEISMLFADVRESTGLAGGMSPSEFSALMTRFFGVATDVLLEADSLVDKFVGDEVVGLFVPVIAGRDHARRAVEAARTLLRETGHGADEPWIPVGVGVHTGRAFLGMVGEGRVSDFTAMGDNVNLAARLGGAARAGEVLVTDATRDAAALEPGLERRTLQLKGIAEPVEVSVLQATEPRVAG